MRYMSGPNGMIMLSLFTVQCSETVDICAWRRTLQLCRGTTSERQYCSQAAGNVRIFNVTCKRRLMAWLAMQQCQTKLSQTLWMRQWLAGHLWLKIATVTGDVMSIPGTRCLIISSAVLYNSMAESIQTCGSHDMAWRMRQQTMVTSNQHLKIVRHSVYLSGLLSSLCTFYWIFGLARKVFEHCVDIKQDLTRLLNKWLYYI